MTVITKDPHNADPALDKFRAEADRMTDRHLGEDASVLVPLRTALDFWMCADGLSIHAADQFEETLDLMSRGAGFDGIVDAYHRCGPGVLSTEDGKRIQRVAR